MLLRNVCQMFFFFFFRVTELVREIYQDWMTLKMSEQLAILSRSAEQEEAAVCQCER